jgi:hypothetical protein
MLVPALSAYTAPLRCVSTHLLDSLDQQGVVGISEIIVRPGLINVDFADVRSVMSNAGTALMGIGRGEGKNRAEDAAAAAIRYTYIPYTAYILCIKCTVQSLFN